MCKTREILTAESCMSGTGWVDDDIGNLECENCGDYLNTYIETEIVKCKNCNTSYKLRLGYLPMRKLELIEE